MFWNPLTTWIVALLADGIVWSNEKSKQRNARVSSPPPTFHPEPHRDPKTGKIVIENGLLYRKDLMEYGACQTMQWVEQGKYNLSPEELAKEEERIRRELEERYKV